MTDQERPSTADAATRHADDRRRARFADQEIRFGRGGDTHQVAGADVPALPTQQGMPVSDEADRPIARRPDATLGPAPPRSDH